MYKSELCRLMRRGSVYAHTTGSGKTHILGLQRKTETMSVGTAEFAPARLQYHTEVRDVQRLS